MCDLLTFRPINVIRFIGVKKELREEKILKGKNDAGMMDFSGSFNCYFRNTIIACKLPAGKERQE